MADPPSSPPHQLPMHTRKRSRAHLAPEPIPSSDPAFFSSDDAHDASVENYQVGRRKKVHTGPWWAQQKSAQEEVASQARKGLSRQPDSGVWLGSDSTEDGVLDDRLQFFGRGRHGPAKFEKDDQELPESTLSEQEDQTVSDGRNPPGSASRKDRGPPLAPNEVEAREIIDECLERGTEVIDLSGLLLTSISASTLRPIHSVIKLPVSTTRAPDDSCYKPLRATICLILSQNQLSAVPFETWTFQNLTVLSLRNNNLTSLPPAIAQLKNLVELNVAGNRLRWLPWEMLNMLCPRGRLRRLTARPNPLVKDKIWDNDVRWPFAFFFPDFTLHRSNVELHDFINTRPELDVHTHGMWLARLYQVLRFRQYLRPFMTPPEFEVEADVHYDEEPVNEEPVDEEPYDEQPYEEEPVDEEPVDGEPVDGEPVGGEPVGGELEDESADEEPVDEELVDEEPVDEEPVDEELDDNESDEESDDEPLIYERPDDNRWRVAPVFITRTEPRYFGPNGTSIPNEPALWSSLPESVTHVEAPAPVQGDEKPPLISVRVPPLRTDAVVPSLLELSLRSLAFSSTTPLHPDSLTPGSAPLSYVPFTLQDFVKDAAAARFEDRRCSVCGNRYVLPRAEWIEFWHYAPDSGGCSVQDLFLPFLRRSCGCAVRGFKGGKSLVRVDTLT